MNATFGAQAFNKPLDLVNTGTTVGVLDPTQPERILRHPSSRLFFASFDPLTASGQGAALDFCKMSLDEDMFRPKRVVIEISPSGQSAWRFVPKAKLDTGVNDEGLWPRVIDICGKLAHCSQDQWDIYKLDPFYQCAVKQYPAITSISPREAYQQPRPPSPMRKRHHSNSSSSNATAPPPKKVHYDASVTMRSVSSLTSDDSDIDEVEVQEMVTDEHYRRTTPTPTTSKRARASSSRATPQRTTRRSKPASQARPISPLTDTTFYHQSRQAHSMPPENQKRKTYDPMDVSNSRIDEDHHEGPARKRANHNDMEPTISPGVTPRQRQAKRREKEELKKKRWEEERKAKIHARDQKLMDEIMADVPPEEPKAWRSERSSSTTSTSTSTTPSVEEAARLAAIEESRRKLAQLEADRPLWDVAAKQRMAREQEEERERQHNLEEKRRADTQRINAEKEKRRQREQEEDLARRQETQQREEAKAKVARDRAARRNRWNSGRWTNTRAFERFIENSDYFEMTRFSETHPLSVDDVPWPTLLHPSSFSLEDVDWASVEHFFDVLKTHLRTQEYISVVEKSHRRFHPDRWRSRNLFKAVFDPAERNCMEVAATTVSQALTPIWQKVRAIKQA